MTVRGDVIEHRLPTAFRSLALLRALNTIAVGASLAALTAACFGHVFDTGFLARVGTAVCASTFVFGAIWVLLLRWPTKVCRTKLRWGWLLSAPLAAANAGTAFALSYDGHDLELVVGFILGATLGAIVWVPSLVATLVCFGLPIAHAQRLAKKGLAGEEIGEEKVGLATVLLGLTALALLACLKAPLMEDVPVRVVAGGFGCLGVFAGGIAAVLARVREDERRRFVRAVEAGSVDGYRVDTSSGGKLIVQTKPAEEGYRIARMDLPVYQLGDDGEAVQGFGEDGSLEKMAGTTR